MFDTASRTVNCSSVNPVSSINGRRVVDEKARHGARMLATCLLRETCLEIWRNMVMFEDVEEARRGISIQKPVGAYNRIADMPHYINQGTDQFTLAVLLH